MQRRLSVVVPTCNRPAQLGVALASIRALEGEDLSIEIIVGDNGDCPRTRDIASAHGARYVRVDRSGASESRNAAMALASGDYIGFLDDDDAWLPGHVRAHLALLEARPDLDGVAGQVRYCDLALNPTGWPDGPEQHPGAGDDLIRRMLSGYFPQIGTVIVRASVRETSGYFDPTLIGGEDLDWLLRLAGRHALGFVSVPCILYSLRPVGDYDALQKQRVGYDRTVFHRHARRLWRVWRSPQEYMRAYSGTLMHFYRYFRDAAVIRAERGERLRALSAVWNALGVFPLRGLKQLLVRSELQQAFLKAILPGPVFTTKGRQPQAGGIRLSWPSLGAVLTWQTGYRLPLPFWLAILHA